MEIRFSVKEVVDALKAQFREIGGNGTTLGELLDDMSFDVELDGEAISEESITFRFFEEPNKAKKATKMPLADELINRGDAVTITSEDRIRAAKSESVFYGQA